jgi:hypothetical protein
MIKFWELLPPRNSESLIFISSNEKHKNWNVQSYKFTFCFVWVWNLISHCKGRTPTEGVEEKKKLLRRIYGTKWQESAICWRKLYNEGPHGLYSLPHILSILVKRMMWVVGGEKCIHDFSRIFEGPREQGKHKHVWKDNATSPTRSDIGMWTGLIWLDIRLNEKMFWTW